MIARLGWGAWKYTGRFTVLSSSRLLTVETSDVALGYKLKERLPLFILGLDLLRIVFGLSGSGVYDSSGFRTEDGGVQSYISSAFLKR